MDINKISQKRNKGEIGGQLLDVKSEDVKEDQEKTIEAAVEAAEARATRELRAATKRLQTQLEQERETALETQKQYYERHMLRVFERRDMADEEKLREVIKKCEKEKIAALAEQKELMLKEKEKALEEALEEMKRKALEEMKEVIKAAREEATRIAMEIARKEKEKAVEKMQQDCMLTTKKEIAKIQKMHAETLAKLQKSYTELEKKYEGEIKLREGVETDFELLQEDYRKFMDYTGGKFHSDYLMRPRTYGRGIVGKDVNELDEDQSLIQLNDVRAKIVQSQKLTHKLVALL